MGLDFGSPLMWSTWISSWAVGNHWRILMRAVVPLAKEPGGLEWVRQKPESHHSYIPLLAGGTCSPSFCHPIHAPMSRRGYCMAVRSTGFGGWLTGFKPWSCIFICLSVSSFSPLEPWFLHLHLGIIIPVSDVLGLNLMVDVTCWGDCSEYSKYSINARWVPFR